MHWGPAVEFAPGAVVSGLESLDLAVPGRGGWEGGRRVSEGRGAQGEVSRMSLRAGGRAEISESWLRDYHSAPAPEHSSQQQDKDMPEMPQMQSGRCRTCTYVCNQRSFHVVLVHVGMPLCTLISLRLR